MNNQFSLMKDRRFLPLFVAQFTGAFNDNLFKTTLSVLAAYGIWDIGGWKPEIVASLAAALFILPFILFAPLAGEIADKYEKTKVVRIIKIAEMAIVGMAILGLALHSIPLLLLVLFLFGVQSAFFNPCKFSILPQHLRADELIAANALLNTGTYIAILSGTIVGGLLAFSGIGLVFTSLLLVVCAIGGYASSRYILHAVAPSPSLELHYNFFRDVVRSIGFARQQPQDLFCAMLGSSWFFFTGAMILSQLPNYTKQTLGVDNIVLTFFMTVFSIGIALGGLLNNKLLHSKVEATFVPAAAFFMAAFSADLYLSSAVYRSGSQILGEFLMTLPAFLSNPAGWHIVFDLLGISIAGGVYIVPLKAIIQHRSSESHKARVIAAGTLLDASFIFTSSLVAIAFLSAGFFVEHLFLLLAFGSVFMAFYIRSNVQGKKN